MDKIQKYILLTIIILSVLLSAEQFYLGTKEIESSDGIFILWAIVFSILIGLWAERDNSRAKFNKPFEFGYFVYFSWPLLLPYYLFKTRGIAGLFTFVGFVTLFLLPSAAWLLAGLYA